MEDKSFKDTKIFKIINSPISIIIALAILVIFLLIYSRFLVRATTLYRFSGYTEEFSILNGTIFTNHNINYFGDSKIIYTGDDIKLNNFKVGYYIKDGDDYSVICEYKGSDSMEDEEVYASIQEIFLNVDLSFTETHKDAEYMSSDNLDNLDKMIFRVTGTDESGEEVNIEVPIDIEKITK